MAGVFANNCFLDFCARKIKAFCKEENGSIIVAGAFLLLAFSLYFVATMKISQAKHTKFLMETALTETLEDIAWDREPNYSISNIESVFLEKLPQSVQQKVLGVRFSRSSGLLTVQARAEFPLPVLPFTSIRSWDIVVESACMSLECIVMSEGL